MKKGSLQTFGLSIPAQLVYVESDRKYCQLRPYRTVPSNKPRTRSTLGSLDRNFLSRNRNSSPSCQHEWCSLFSSFEQKPTFFSSFLQPHQNISAFQPFTVKSELNLVFVPHFSFERAFIPDFHCHSTILTFRNCTF